MSKKDRSLANSRDEAKKIYYQRKEINKLQQENQKLKEENKDMKRTIELFSNSLYNCDLKRYKSVLDEIRDYLNKDYIPMDGDESAFKEDIAEILDKVKE